VNELRSLLFEIQYFFPYLGPDLILTRYEYLLCMTNVMMVPDRNTVLPNFLQVLEVHILMFLESFKVEDFDGFTHAGPGYNRIPSSITTVHFVKVR